MLAGGSRSADFAVLGLDAIGTDESKTNCNNKGANCSENMLAEVDMCTAHTL